jgi:hypothetical protein
MVLIGFELIEGLAFACDSEFLLGHAFLDDGLFHARIGACQTFRIIGIADVRIALAITGVVTCPDFASERSDHGKETSSVGFLCGNVSGMEQDQIVLSAPA